MSKLRKAKTGLLVAGGIALGAAMLSVPLSPQIAWAGTDTYAFITDTHIGAGTSTPVDTAKAFSYIKKQKNLKAVVHCGDITDVGGEKEYRKYLDLWNKSGLKVARIQTMGNHDNATGGYQKWLHKAGYYGYTKNTGINFFKKLLNGGKIKTVTEFPKADIITISGPVKQKGGVFPASTLTWLDKHLKSTVRSGKMAIVVCHYAPWHGTDDKFKRIPKRFHEVVGICQSYPNVIYVCGHEHLFEQDTVYFSKHCQKYTYSKAVRNTIKRNGIDASKSNYPMNLLCLNSVSRIYGFQGKKVVPERKSWVYTLSLKDGGGIDFATYNQTDQKKMVESFKQDKTSVSITVNLPKKVQSQEVSVKVSFSDKAAHSGIASGSVVKMTPGKALKIDGIPAGVLVTANPVTDIEGCSKPEKQQLELGLKAGKMALSYK